MLLKNTEIKKRFTRASNFSVSSQSERGFTLVELMVSISLFAIVMTISMGSIFSVFNANEKSESLRAVMDNLNFTLEAMTRTIRFGINYHCDATTGVISVPRDCAGGADSFSVLDSSGRQVTYKLSGTRIARVVNGGSDYYLTSADVTIQKLKFYVFGSTLYSNGGDLYQPQVIMVVGGYAGGVGKSNSQTSFSLETTVSQRSFDSQ